MKPTIPSVALFASLALVGFTSQGKPVDVMPEADECATCAMAVTDVPLSAEITLKNGDVKKFDDIGCMAQYVRRKKLLEDKIKGMFVHDLKSERWLPLERAILVKSTYPTPMRYGIVAFSSLADAKALPARYKGKTVTWSSVLKGF
ncbi:MAG TPA: nitrous oxide reductase accessory protein NosL [Pantanalinema sp.]